MLHHVAVESRTVLSERERETLIAVAEAAIPPGRLMPGAGAATVARVEAFLAIAGRSVAQGYRALIATVDGLAYARWFRPFARLELERRERILENLRRSDYVRRTALRALVTPLKI